MRTDGRKPESAGGQEKPPKAYRVRFGIDQRGTRENIFWTVAKLFWRRAIDVGLFYVPQC